MAPRDTLAHSPVPRRQTPARAGGEIVLFSPEHFYVFNTLAVPQLTGYLLDRGYPVVQRVLDNELYRHLAATERLERALDELAAGQAELAPEHVAYLADAIGLAMIPQELGFRSDEPSRTLAGLLRRREAAVRLLHRSEALLRERFLGLSKNRFLLALGRLQVAVDVCFAPFWPSKYGILGGFEPEGGSVRSRTVYATSGDAALNPFLDYYRQTVVPSIPEGAALAGISITHEAQIVPAFTLARVIREQRPGLHITLGGATVSTLRETLAGRSAVAPLYDSLVIGAGEEAVAGLHDRLASGSSDLSGVAGLVWRGADGALRHNPAGDFTVARAATPGLQRSAAQPDPHARHVVRLRLGPLPFLPLPQDPLRREPVRGTPGGRVPARRADAHRADTHRRTSTSATPTSRSGGWTRWPRPCSSPAPRRGSTRSSAPRRRSPTPGSAARCARPASSRSTSGSSRAPSRSLTAPTRASTCATS